MPIDELILSETQVDIFCTEWVWAMQFSQNSDDHPGDESEAVAIIERMLPKSDYIKVEQHDISPDKNRPNLLVTFTPPNADPSKKGILFAGVHTDCVLVASRDQLKYKLEGEKGIGRGVLDNGSNVLAGIELLRYLAEKTPNINRPITVAFTADEEASSTHLGFEGLVKEDYVNTNDYAAAVFADTPWCAWSTKGVGLYSLDVKIDGSGHSGVFPSAYTIGFELFGLLQRTLAEKFPERGLYNAATIMQANIMTPEKKDGPTGTAPEVSIKGDIRSNPKYTLTEIVDTLNKTAEEFIENLKTNPQTEGYADKINIEFKASAHEDGYVMPDDFVATAERIIHAGFEAAGIEGIEPTRAIGGGLPGLRGFVEKGLLTIATGAGGRPEIVDEYHAPTEHVFIEDVRKGPAYFFGLAKQLDKELTEMGK